MKNKGYVAAIEAAKNEGQIKVSELIEEIKPVLKDYFVGYITGGHNAIVYRTPNGQTFLISVRQVEQRYSI